VRRFAFIAVLLCACSWQERVALLELNDITPELLEPGARLRIDGRGFPSGGLGRARVTGTLRAPGRAAERIDVSLPVQAESGDALSIDGDALFEALGARGTFEGSVEVAFDAKRARAALTGARALRLDLVGEMSSGQQALRASAQRVLEHAGLVIEGDVGTHEGIAIAAVEPDSAADLAGMIAGDVIAVASGVRVHGLSDLAPPPLTRELPLELRREGASELIALRLPIERAAAHSAWPLTRLSVLLCFALSLPLLLGGAPRALRKLLARVRLARPATLGIFGARLPVTTRRIGLALLVSLAGVLLVCFEPAGFLSVRSITLYLPLLAIGVALVLMREGVERAERLRGAGLLLGRMTVMGVVFSCACALSGTRALDGIVATQGAWPIQWGALQCPALALALPLFVVYGAQLGDADASELAQRAGLSRRLLDGERVMTNVVFAALGAAIFLGGWQSPTWLTLGPWPERLPGALLFVLKAWAVALVLASARRMQLGLRVRTTLGLTTAMVVLTALDVWLEPVAGARRVLGQAWLGALVVCVVAAFASAPVRLRERAGAAARAR
jgi:hypothetical protein